MAKRILAFFGGLSILIGGLMLLAAFMVDKGGAMALTFVLPIAAAFLLAGAPLLGFARVITLLERIEANTRKDDVTRTKLRVDPAL